MAYRAELGGKAFLETVEMLVQEFEQDVQEIMRAYMADGYPPGSVPAPPEIQLRRLQAFEEQGDPAYWMNKRAPAAKERLERKVTNGGP